MLDFFQKKKNLFFFSFFFQIIFTLILNKVNLSLISVCLQSEFIHDLAGKGHSSL